MSAGGFAVPVGTRALLSDLGVTPANVLRRASLPADLLARPSVRLTPEKYFAFFEAIEAEAQEVKDAIGRLRRPLLGRRFRDAFPEFEGQLFRFSGLGQRPRPAQERIPLWVGGSSPAGDPTSSMPPSRNFRGASSRH